jgi:hypothetical protein
VLVIAKSVSAAGAATANSMLSKQAASSVFIILTILFPPVGGLSPVFYFYLRFYFKLCNGNEMSMPDDNTPGMC